MNIQDHPLYRRHTIDSALSSTWEFYKKHFLVLFGVSLVLSLINQFLARLINVQELQSITDPVEMMEKLSVYIVPIVIISVVNLFFTTIIQHYIIHKPLDGSHNIFRSLLQAFRYFFPFLIAMIILSFIGSIAIVLGFLALIVGAFFAVIYVLTLYLFMLPIMLVEGANIGHTITRTFTLAHRGFWRNIGWTAIFFIIIMVISVVLTSIIMIPFAGDFVKTIMNPGETSMNYTSNPVYLILSALAGALTFPLMPIFSSVLFLNARAMEDQPEKIIEEVKEYRPTVEDLYAPPRKDED